MNIFNEYRAYMKDNPKGLWFKRKLYGWGWTPVTWQGWMAILGFIVILVTDSIRTAQPLSSTDVPPIAFLLRIVLYVGVLMAVCYKKGEKPKWQWGPPKEKDTTPKE